jgi:hypothetical protein
VGAVNSDILFNPHDLGAIAARFIAIPQIDPALEIFAPPLLRSGTKFFIITISGIIFLKARYYATLLEIFTNMDLTKPTELVNY